jgi:cytochrome c
MPRFVAAAVILVITPATTAFADAGQGERVFQRCAACHSVADNDTKLPGPNLRGVIGRRAGTLSGFEYSSAMVDAGKTENVTWDRKTLDKYLADPDDVVPGTAMRMNFQLTPNDRADVIDFLEQKK